MQRVSELVHRPEVALLGLGWLSVLGAGLRGQQSLRKYRAWCSPCFGRMRSDGKPLYAPLQWDFAQIRCCAIHGCTLSVRCSACGKQSPVARERRHHLGLCDTCGVALEASEGEDLAADFSIEIEKSRALSEQLGLLFGCVQQVVPDDVPSFADLIVRLHRAGCTVSASELARRMGCSKGTISDLAKGRGMPSLDLLLRLATALAVPLPDLLLMSDQRGGLARRRVKHAPITWPARRRPRKNWHEVQRAFEFEATSPIPASVPHLARRTGVDPKHLNIRLPEKVLLQRQRHSANAEQERKVRVARALVLIEEAWEGEVTSQRKVADAIGVGRSRRCFREAWEDAGRLTDHESG